MNKFIPFCLLAAGLAFAQEDSPFQFNGFVDTYHALQREYPHDWVSSRTRVRAELKASYDNAFLFASVNAIQNNIVKSETGFSLNEAFFDYSNDWIEIKAGKQIVVWGVTDEGRITDLISPLDYTEFIANDYDDLRMAVNAIDIKYPGEKINAEFIFVPVASFDKIPTDTLNPWHVQIPNNLALDLDTPEERFKNSEYGTRLRFFLEYLDFSITALHTYNKTPVTVLSMDSTGTLVVKGIYKPMTVLGGDVSIPLGEIVVRGEAAEYLKEAIADEDGLDYSRKNTFNGALGIDWYAPHDWTIVAQYVYRYTGEHQHVASLQVSKEMLGNTLEISFSGEYDFNDSGFFGRLSAQYALNDQISLSLGYDHIYGDDGYFGMYKHNSEFWAKGKFFF